MRGLLLSLLVLGIAHPAWGHTFAPSLLELRQQDERVEIRFKQPNVRVVGSRLRPVLPSGCHPMDVPSTYREGTGVVTRWQATCPDLVGQPIEVHGIATSRAHVLLRVELADGRSVHQVLTPDTSVFVVPRSTGLVDIVGLYARLGVEHMLSGLDHLLFVLALVLLIDCRRRLVATVTAFTLGHSVTLALAALGIVHVPQGPTEVAIALSIYVLAVELTRPKAPVSWLRRSPWSMAVLFGLLHGLGFAGALSEIGLPDVEIPAALVSFNVGIELGQLGFVAIVLVARGGLARLPQHWVARLSPVPAYAIGSLAVFWVLERSL